MAAPGLGLLRVPLLNAQSVDETTSTPVNCLGYKNITIYFKRSTSITGVVTVEEADFNPTTESGYSGTWSVIVAFDVSTMTTDQFAYHAPSSAFSQVRTRISTVIGGGTVSTVLTGV